MFEICLAKFFAENCMALELLEVDDGKQWFFAHIGWAVERWGAKALEQSVGFCCRGDAEREKENG